MTDRLSDEEHRARAMLMGMCYHHGNGDPVYYKEDGGIPVASSFIDANTLEPLYRAEADPPFLMPKARTAWFAMANNRRDKRIRR